MDAVDFRSFWGFVTGSVKLHFLPEETQWKWWSAQRHVDMSADLILLSSFAFYL